MKGGLCWYDEELGLVPNSDQTAYVFTDKGIEQLREDIRSGRIEVIFTSLITELKKPVPCIGKDDSCPCQDGLACHYKAVGNTPAWPIPKEAE